MIQPAVQHPNEPQNRRSLLLRLRRTIWLVPLAAVAGALLGALIYGVVWLSVSGQRQYQQTSKYYLTFGYEENGEVADYYNAYTWNDLLFSISSISEVIEEELPDGVSLSEAQEAIEADILSDVRLLTITVTHSDPDAVQQMTNAVEDALIRYGANAIQFTSIDFLSSSEVEAVVVSDRTRNAVLLGAVLGFLAAAVWLWLREVLDDGIYVPEDAVRRYGIPVVLILPAEGTQLPDFLVRDNNDALRVLPGRDAGPAPETVTEESPGEEKGPEEVPAGESAAAKEQPEGNGASGARAVPDFCDEKAQDGDAAGAEKLPEESSASGARAVRIVCEDMELAQETAQLLRDTYHVNAAAQADPAEETLLVIAFGRANGTRTEHLIEHLRAQGQEIGGIVLTGADGRFLAQYYGTGHAKGRKQTSPDA